MSNKIRSILSFLLLICMVLTTNTLPIKADGFVDVEEGDKYFVAINYLKEQGIISGYNDNTFRAHEEINRAEALKIITLATGLFEEGEFEEGEIESYNEDSSSNEADEDIDNEDNSSNETDEDIDNNDNSSNETDEDIDNNDNSSNETDKDIDNEEKIPFTDTPPSAWYTPYIKAAKDRGIIKGYQDNTYKPNQTVKLVEALKILEQAAEIADFPDITEDTVFADTGTDLWYSKYVAYAKQHTLINVSASNQIFPDQELTRGYLAEIIYRFLKRGEIEEFGKATFYGAAVQGNGTASGLTFDKDGYTAAHKTLPFGTIVRVTNLANGKSVNVEITDRGPYGYGRTIDLSSAAFEQIAWLGTGVIYVQTEIIKLSS